MVFTLQILHASDLEGSVGAITNAPNFATIVDALEADAAALGIESILLSAGDNYIPGPFFNAAGDASTFNPLFEGFYNEFFGLTDVSALPTAADVDGNGVFDNAEIDAFLTSAENTAGLVASDVYVTDVNGDGNPDYFDEIDNFEGRVDITIMNILDFDASAVGNHEFDAGTDSFENTINYDSEEGNSLSSTDEAAVLAEFPDHVNFLQEVDWPGVQFPYLTSNLDFSGDFDVGPLFTDQILPNTAFESDLLSAREPLPGAEADFSAVFETAGDPPDSNDPKIAPATTIQAGDEVIGVVGATTQVVESISSTGNIFDITGGSDDVAALAAVLQPQVDALVAQGVNKIIIVSHLQQFALEQELATLMTGVDVIIAGGSDTISADAQDRLRPEDVGAETQPYPFTATGADGNPVAIVSTDGEYSYVGRLVVTFDENGVIIPGSIDENVSGAFATDDLGVADVTGAATAEEAIAASDKGSDVQLLVDAASGVVNDLDGQIFGETELFIEGRREFVRTEETTLGNLTADANLVVAQKTDPTVQVSLKNGGGIRSAIGQTDENGELLTTQANPFSGKEEGEISLLDIQNALRFDNDLVLVDLSAEDLKIVLEHAVSATEPGATPGQFAQVGGLRFSFDPSGTPQELDGGTVVTPGTRVQTVALIDEDGNTTDVIVENGAVVDGAPEAIRIVTLDFLFTGGDGYPFQELGENAEILLADGTSLDFDTFDALPGADQPETLGEQQALADFLSEEFPADGDVAFSEIETSVGFDTRIQNLDERTDLVDAPVPTGIVQIGAELSRFDSGVGEGGAEIVAQENGLAYVTNGESDAIDVFNIVTGEGVGQIDLTTLPGFDGVNSVDVKNGVVAVAVAGDGAAKGQVAFYDATSLALLGAVPAGNLPDAVTFTPDGTKVVVSNEGEPVSADENPVGSITIIDISAGVENATTQEVSFAALNGTEDDLREAGIRVFPGFTAAEDFEPEFAAVSPDGATAYVSLQENNALAIIDLDTATLTEVVSQGTVDFSLPGNEIDPSDRDGGINLANFPVQGFRMADGIDTFEIDGETFVITANEGDAREFTVEEEGDAFAGGEILDLARGEDLVLDPSLAPAPTVTLTPDEVVTVTGSPAPINSTASGTVTAEFITLDDGSEALAYSITFDGLDLVENPEDRVDANDVTAVHFQIGAPGENGEHALNIFGAPRMDDADVVIDFEAETITGIYDDSDQNFVSNGLRDVDDSVALSTVRDALLAGDIYVDAHTVAFDTPNTSELRAQLNVSPPPTASQAEDQLGRLEVSLIDGDTDGDGDVDEIFAFGGRSFSIFDADGVLVYDSGALFAEIAATFNADEFQGNDGEFDTRSDDAGVEPESVVTGVIGDKTFAFIGLERDSGIVVMDVSDPAAPEFVDYFNGSDEAGDVSPEGLEFVAAADSPTGGPLLLVSYEVTGTTVVYEIESVVPGFITGASGQADTLIGSASGDIILSDALDAVDGGDGVDTIDFSAIAAPNPTAGAFDGIIIDLDVNSAGAAGTPSEFGGLLSAPPAAGGTILDGLTIDNVENVIGTDFNDGLFGNNEVNILRGGGGDDVIHSFGGDDIVDGGEGNDTALFSAGAGVTVVLDETGGATVGDGEILISIENLTGSATGADNLTGNSGANVLNGLGGDDFLFGLGGNDVVNGDDGDDVINLGSGDDQSTGGAGADTMFGVSGDDVMIGNGGADLIIGSSGNDTLTGSDGDDRMFGGDGDDTMRGGDDNDVLFGNAGDDFLGGNDGDDVVFGGQGNNVLRGGEGADTFFFNGSEGMDIVRDFETGVDQVAFAADGSFDTLDIVADGADAVISFGNRTIELQNVDVAALSEDDFVFNSDALL